VTAPTADLTLFERVEQADAALQVAADFVADARVAVDRLRPTLPVAEVPVDGSVDVRWVVEHGRWSGWHQIVGDQRCSADCVHLWAADMAAPMTLNPDEHVQVRPHVAADVFVQDGGKA
jgi:hypothetical protein